MTFLKTKCNPDRNCVAATGLGCTTVGTLTTCFCDTDLCNGNGSETIGIKPMVAIITAMLTISIGRMV